MTGPRAVAGGVPEGFDALLLGELARHAGAPVLHVARDGNRLATLEEAISFFAPDVTVLSFPAWDSVPYDRVAPNAEIIADRIATLAALTEREAGDKTPLVLLTSVNAVVQRVPPREFIAGSSLKLKAGNVMSMQALIERLEASGYVRAGTVTDPGQYAVRGGILDLFPPGGQPVRLDFFGDTLETIRAFDPETQRTEARLEAVHFLPMSEVALTPDVRRHFRQRYVELFGPVKGDDPLYEAISAGHQHQGMEHWLPLFHDHLATLFDYLPDAVVTLDPLSDDARATRLEQIADHYDARAQALERKAFGAPPYHPVPAESMFLSEAEWQDGACRGAARHRARHVRAAGGGRRQHRLLRRPARPLLRARAADRRRQRVRRRGGACQEAARRAEDRHRRLLERRRARTPRHAAHRAWLCTTRSAWKPSLTPSPHRQTPHPSPSCRSRPASRPQASP